MKSIISLLMVGCMHSNYTWPITGPDGNTHVACLNCGRDLPYDFKALGGEAAQFAEPRITAPNRLVLDTPGRVNYIEVIA